MQGTRVRSLVREDPTCRRATKLVRHNYWACALEPTSYNYWSPRATATEAHTPSSPCSATREATAMRSPRTATKSSPRSPQQEKARAQQRRLNRAKNKKKIIIKIKKLKKKRKQTYLAPPNTPSPAFPKEEWETHSWQRSAAIPKFHWENIFRAPLSGECGMFGMFPD